MEKKVCDVNNYIIFEFSDDSIEIGNYFDIFKKLMSAIHHVNTNTSDGTYCAVTFPNTENGEGLVGNKAIIFGSNEMLKNFRANNFVKDMIRKEMAYVSNIKETNLDTVKSGTFVSKIRGLVVTEKTLAKENRRREKRGNSPIKKLQKNIVKIEGEIKKVYCSMKKDLFLSLSVGDRDFDRTKDFMINSYGVSSQSEISIFPKI